MNIRIFSIISKRIGIGLAISAFLLAFGSSPSIAGYQSAGACPKEGQIATINRVTYKCSLAWITQTSNATPKARTASTATSVIFSGQGGLDEDTLSQHLNGNYKISWQTLGDCTYYASLSGKDIFSANSAATGINYLHSLQSGSYFVHMITGPAPDCAWRVTFTSIK